MFGTYIFILYRGAADIALFPLLFDREQRRCEDWKSDRDSKKVRAALHGILIKCRIIQQPMGLDK